MRMTINDKRERRSTRVRGRITGSKERPRLSIYRSSKHIAAQLIDDESGKTLLSSSDSGRGTKGTKHEKAVIVGHKLAEKALKAGIKKVVFDRRSYRYHGRVAAVAEAARKAGLEL